MAWAGAYVGDGVSTTNLAGRTLRDLILGQETELTGLPWVNHRSRLWEPEPLRWMGVNAALKAMGSADAVEARTAARAGGRPTSRSSSAPEPAAGAPGASRRRVLLPSERLTARVYALPAPGV